MKCDLRLSDNGPCENNIFLETISIDAYSVALLLLQLFCSNSLILGKNIKVRNWLVWSFYSERNQVRKFA